jgi:hypothetical protein
MIEADKRKSIYLLHQDGVGIRKIARLHRVDKNTVRAIIEQKGEIPTAARTDKIEIDPDVLRTLYKDCDGWVQRIHERLSEEMGIDVGYSTLTRQIRELEIGKPRKKRCGQVPDEPGEEFQHDTTTYKIKLGAKRVKLVASLLYFRFSKVRYLKFYRSFNRFAMKCFFHEALMFWKFCASICIIDNTNLARLRGTGKNAVMVPEMEHFAKQYGFEFQCHEKGHANRKAGEERSFWTVETNFLPGRKFEDVTDINQQAFQWATVKMFNRPAAKTGLIPAKAFEFEQSYLKKLPPYISAPYLCLSRQTDQYGYIPVNGNYYWVPGTSRYQLTVLRYADSLKVYHERKLLAEYDLAPEDVKNEKFAPRGREIPKFQPKNRKKPTLAEEEKLRAVSEEVDAYLNFAFNPDDRKRHALIRGLFGLYRKIAPSLFIETVKRARKYRIGDLETIERIAVLQMRDGNYPTPIAPIDREFETRQAYLDGRLGDDVDLTGYDDILNENDEEQE